MLLMLLATEKVLEGVQGQVVARPRDPSKKVVIHKNGEGEKIDPTNDGSTQCDVDWQVAVLHKTFLYYIDTSFVSSSAFVL
jgi:hypothetical protein